VEMKWNLKRFEDLSLGELYDILKLRSEIFVVEQNCPYQDLDGKDKVSYHLFLEDNGVVIAALRIIPENISYKEMSIGRVVVKKSYRGKGISKDMMGKAIGFITENLKKDGIRLSGQAYLVDFYEALGFKKVSDVYLEDGIEHFEFLYEV